MTAAQWFRHACLLFVLLFLVALSAGGCGPARAQLAAVDHAPLPGHKWDVSTPEEQSLDPLLVARLCYDAAELASIREVLLVKGGKLIGERCFRGGAIDRKDHRHSVTKSFISTVVGRAGAGMATEPRSEDGRLLPRVGRSDRIPEEEDHG